MRTIFIEIVEPESNDVESYICKSVGYFNLLIELGMSAKQLHRRGQVEFLTKGGAQYRVTLMDKGTFVGHSQGGNV